LAAQATATAQVEIARAQADTQDERMAYIAWQQRFASAARYLQYCNVISEVASSTTSVAEAVATARARDNGHHQCTPNPVLTP
jgi:hypothetical protein